MDYLSGKSQMVDILKKIELMFFLLKIYHSLDFQLFNLC